MSEITVNFEFEIGDIVYFKTATHNDMNVPRKHIIMERVAQQCHGGIQRFYIVEVGKHQVPELVLTKDVPVYVPKSKEAIEEMLVNEKMVRDARRHGWSGVV